MEDQIVQNYLEPLKDVQVNSGRFTNSNILKRQRRILESLPHGTGPRKGTMLHIEDLNI